MKQIAVTGASRGIGFELIQALANQGCRVFAISRNIKPIEALNHPNILPFSVDISNQNHLLSLKNELIGFGTLHGLVNNAGCLINKPFAQTTTEDFEAVFRVNVFGLAALTRLLLPILDPKGHVVNISSMGGLGSTAKFPGLSAYSSSKGAVSILTELLAEEYKTTGPAFNGLALGAVQTEMLAEAFPDYNAPLQASEMADYVADFVLTGHQFYNGKVLAVSTSTP